MKRGALLVVAACSSGSADPEPVAEPPPVAKPDAQQVAPEPPSSDPIGQHIDDDAPKKPPPSATKHASHPIDITLRSTPSPARVLVDGMLVGLTPTYWSGNADGMPHVFVFIYEPPRKNMQRYAVAQYKFVPVTSGVVHARLEPIASDDKEPPPPPEALPFMPAPAIDAGVPRADAAAFGPAN